MKFAYTFFDLCGRNENPLYGLKFTSSIMEIYNEIKRSYSENIAIKRISNGESISLFTDDVYELSDLISILREEGLI